MDWAGRGRTGWENHQTQSLIHLRSPAGAGQAQSTLDNIGKYLGKTVNWPHLTAGATSFVCYLMRGQKLGAIKIIGQIFYLKWWLERRYCCFSPGGNNIYFSLETFHISIICPQLSGSKAASLTTHNWANWDIRLRNILQDGGIIYTACQSN